jgi:hypothetical protein
MIAPVYCRNRTAVALVKYIVHALTIMVFATLKFPILLLVISLFQKEITVHSGIVWRDKIYGDRRQICEKVEGSTIKYQLFGRPKMKYLLFTLNV